MSEAQAPSSSVTASRWSARPTPRSSPTCSAVRSAVGGRNAGRRHARGRPVKRLEGAFTLVAVDAQTPASSSPPAATRRWSSGSATARTSSPATSPPSSRTPAEAMEIGQEHRRRDSPPTVPSFTTAYRRQSCSRARSSTSTGTPAAAEKGGHPYFMLKEIEEQPQAVADTLRGRVTEAGTDRDGRAADERRRGPRSIDKIFIVACGTSYHAAMIAKYAIEHWVRIPCEVDIASEFRYRDPVLDRDTLVIAISQSGETADILRAVEHATEQKARVLAISNTVGSTLARDSDAVLYTRAGPEIGVASTKTFLAHDHRDLSRGAVAGRAPRRTPPRRGRGRGPPAAVAMPALTSRARIATIEPVRDLARKLAGQGRRDRGDLPRAATSAIRWRSRAH